MVCSVKEFMRLGRGKKKILKSFLEKLTLALSSHRAWLLSKCSVIIKYNIILMTEISLTSHLS